MPARQSKLRQVKAHLPTAQAARALRRPPVLVFCLSMFLTSMGSAAFGAFFPLYLTDVVGVAQHWIAPITNVGVVFEIFFMLGFGWFLSRWGFKRLIVVGMLCMTLRMLTLAMFPSTAVAVGTQLIHGMVVLATTVAPVMYLNQQASDTDRNSIQGLYTMAIRRNFAHGRQFPGGLRGQSQPDNCFPLFFSTHFRCRLSFAFRFPRRTHPAGGRSLENVGSPHVHATAE
jgi:PPP family 3-phenylpropionic acid transporter